MRRAAETAAFAAALMLVFVWISVACYLMGGRGPIDWLSVVGFFMLIMVIDIALAVWITQETK